MPWQKFFTQDNVMLKNLKSVALDILEYILAFTFSALFIIISTYFPEKVALGIAGIGIFISFYISDFLVDKLR